MSYNFDFSYKINDDTVIAGTDEAGRGPLAGPVVAAAVILDYKNPIEGLNDSKKLSELKRKTLYEKITSLCISYQVCFISHEEIDEINIYQASKKAMETCLLNLSRKPEVVLSDAMPLTSKNAVVHAIIKGDSLSASIMAASILAKVSRDNYMHEMDALYPGYGFAKHKGYPTKAHREAIRKLGPCNIHRKTFKLL
jgi:ribonuclease HII